MSLSCWVEMSLSCWVEMSLSCWVEMSQRFLAPTCDDVTDIEWVWVFEPLLVMMWQSEIWAPYCDDMTVLYSPGMSLSFWAPTCDDVTVLEWVWVYEPLLVMIWQFSNESEFLSPLRWWYGSSQVIMWQSSNESEFWAPCCDDTTVLKWVWVYEPYLWWCDSPRTSQCLGCPAEGKDSWNLPPLWRLVVVEPSQSPPHLLQP